MFWLTEGDVLFKWLADEEPLSLADIEISETLVDEDEAEVWNCDALRLADTLWLKLAVTLWDIGSDLLENDSLLTVTDGETFTIALVEDTLGLSVCETFLDALSVSKEPEKAEASRICDYLDSSW